MEGRGSEGWIPVNNSNTISPEVACNQMFCGTNASQITDDEGVQLNCTGDASEWSAETFKQTWKKILTFVFFTDDISVFLKNQNGDSRCYGGVHIRVNKTTRAVCASSWSRAEAEVVCRELQCGKVGVQSGYYDANDSETILTSQLGMEA